MLIIPKTHQKTVKMGETQTILKKIETSARKRLEKTKELLKEYLNQEQNLEAEPETEEKSEESEWNYR